MSSSNVEPKEERELLPTTVVPRHYDLSLTPDLVKHTYHGHVSIDLDVTESTSQIILHATYLEIEKATFSSDSLDGALPATKFDFNKENETLTLGFDQEIKAGTKGKLSLSFTGILNNEMAGFYRSSYKDAEGNTKYLGTTQFEPTSARRAFPCFDEPKLKATFGVTLVVPENLTALSNMDEKETTKEENGLKRVVFNDTPLMSTYLLAFVVGEFEYVEAFTSGEFNEKPIRCRVYTLPGEKEKGTFALDVATKALEFFADKFGIAYPLPKLDQIAIPDFEAGAMENWGLVTYRTVALLINPKESRIKSRQRVAYVVCHELAHQWFGNLVTMEWWSELWLNEGFATWVGTLAVDYIYPEWNSWTTFIVDDFDRALQLDSKRSSHPIQVPVPRSSQITQIFDAISYSKGASTIRMLSSFIGLDTFLKGIRQYLKKHKYNNASTDDLWSALSDASGQDVSKFMNLWTKQVGYPVLTVTEEENDTIRIRQNRFISSGDVNEEEDKNLWWVPLNILTSADDASQSSSAVTTVLTQRETTISLPPGTLKNGWYKLNRGTVGIFRVKYPEETIKRLAGVIESGTLSTPDRIGIISDLGALAISGMSKTSNMLTLFKSSVNEEDDDVWEAMHGNLFLLSIAWLDQSEDIREKLKTFRRNLFSPLAKKLGFVVKRGEDNMVTRLRARALTSAGNAGDTEVIAKAQEWLNAIAADPNTSAVPADLIETMFVVAVGQGGKEEYEAAKQYYLDESNPIDQRLVALQAIGSTNIPELMDDALEFALSDKVRGQDVHTCLLRLSLTPVGREKVWQWYKANYEQFVKRYGDSMSYLGILVRLAASRFSSEEKAREVEEFFVGKDVSRFDRALSQCLESIRTSAGWVSRDAQDVKEWLDVNVQ
ncbi:hypothetical protein H4219_002023 [Mycoemilia scoparia]|uniref:Aminopeptidase n=1 Tax=Mycoemilia scoparia TaxID=417184 RepID=A0A9W8DUY1_9FUNG|nr:hypothetical protein H4219_002023 [Mycoemilia scoparia]